MSIINDALKKLQQGFDTKSNAANESPSTAAEEPVERLSATPSAVETLTQTVQKIAQQKPSIQNIIQSKLFTTCVLLITIAISIACAEYIYHQLQNNVPKVQRLAQRSFATLVHRRQLPKAFSNPKPLAQLTITPTSSSASSQSAAPITLNVHGIMANATGNVALINDQVYQEGDDVDGAKIVKIDLDSITVSVNGTEKIIPVNN